MLRVGETWRPEDHAMLVKHLSEVDELCVVVWKRLLTSNGTYRHYPFGPPRSPRLEEEAE